ncbi:MAG TPA: Rieske 2Fe-2S domain-containing protein [Acidimicrobiales bacterium]|nr:Rieske 2Fe-2S domain-containing protein [Acidimicrobiales bacterium]
MATDLDSTWVSVERGEIDRRIFSDPDIFEQEMELIFGRAWLFLCHESQIPRPGDFFEAPMGRDNVLVVRQRDGGIKALLNTCAHRGNAVCRAEEGNARNFMCTYHGWTYDIAGNLIGVPGLEDLYGGDLDPSRHGLAQVAQVDSHEGFVFATMDPSAPPLPDYLGETGTLGLNLIAAQGDMEVIPGIQKFVIPCNWKFAVDNLFDWYHPQVTHLSALQTGMLGATPPGARLMDSGGAQTPDGREIQLPGGAVGGDVIDSIVCLDTYGHAIAGPTAEAFGAGGLFDDSWRRTERARELLGPVGSRVAGHPNIFPTLWVSSTTQASLRIPRGPMETEIWWFSFVDRDLPPDQRAMRVFAANHVFGPAGLLEQEDGENWAQSTIQTIGHRSRQVPQLLRMNLGRGKVVRDGQSPPRIEGTTSEHAQLWTFAAWSAWMSGCGWDELRRRTVPPEVL